MGVTAERIRDKIGTSKRKGLWVGGVVPLGYDAAERKLVVNEGEATTVRRLFDLYLQHGTVERVCEEARRMGMRTKVRAYERHGRQGGEPLRRGYLYKPLSNPIYIGEIAHKGERFQGEHPAIVDRATWEAVQAQLARHAVVRRRTRNGSGASLLAVLLVDAEGRRLGPTHACKQGRRYRYYTSANEGDRIRWRLPASAIESAVCDAVAELLRDGRRLMTEVLPASLPAVDLKVLLSRAEGLGQQFHEAGPSERRDLLLDLVERIEVAEDRIRISFRADRLLAQAGDDAGSGATVREVTVPATPIVVIERPVELLRRGRGTRIVIGGGARTAGTDGRLVALVSRAHRWFAELRDGRAASVRDLARRHGVNKGDISRVLPLAFLAPDIVEAILAGRQPAGLTVTGLRRGPDLPISWIEQRRLLGFA